MSAGLFALFDDVAALAKMAAASVDDVAAAAAKTSAKAAGVVVDDTAVTPQYVDGVHPERELPMIAKIARGSLINKLLIILPAALVLSQFAPWLLTPILMVGGAYLSFEGVEKIIEWVRPHNPAAETPEERRTREGEEAVVADGKHPDEEKRVVSNAIRTDFILSAEIMVISLNEVASLPLLQRTIILVLVAIGITLLVYGVVGLLVKMDDIGLAMAKRNNAGSQKIGLALVKAMPKVMNAISTVGIFAMLWVGGHILLTGLAKLGFGQPEEVVHMLEHAVHGVPVIGAFLEWLVNTLMSLIFGTAIGAVVVWVMHFFHRKDSHGEAAAAH